MLFSQRKLGKRAFLRVVNVRIYAYIVHFNHGHLAALLLILLILFGFYNSILFGLLGGLALQALVTKDLYAKS